MKLISLGTILSRADRCLATQEYTSFMKSDVLLSQPDPALNQVRRPHRQTPFMIHFNIILQTMTRSPSHVV